MPQTLETLMKPIFAALALSVALSACSQEAPQTPPVPAQPAAAPAPVAAVPLPQADPATPLAQYQTLNSGNQLMFLYHALSRLPIDEDAAAQSLSRDYATTSDAFRKRDLLAALKPRIDAGISGATPYLRLDVNGSRSLLDSYDFKRQGFNVKEFSDSGSSRYFHDNTRFQIRFSNTEQVNFFPVKDEDAARQIEGSLNRHEELILRIYAFANDTDPARQHVKAVVTRLVLTDPRGKVLAEFTP